jgi:hypothetical protein
VGGHERRVLDLLHLAHLALALAQDLLGPLALGDVAADAGEPAHALAGRGLELPVPQAQAAAKSAT